MEQTEQRAKSSRQTARQASESLGPTIQIDETKIYHVPRGPNRPEALARSGSPQWVSPIGWPAMSWGDDVLKQ